MVLYCTFLPGEIRERETVWSVASLMDNLTRRPPDHTYADHVSSGVTAAVIAAVVSIVVAAGSVTVTFLTTRASLRRDHERQEAEFRRTMTERLYDRRVAVYPGLFRATDAFRSSHSGLLGLTTLRTCAATYRN